MTGTLVVKELKVKLPNIVFTMVQAEYHPGKLHTGILPPVKFNPGK